MKACKLCRENTDVIFTINFKAVAICEDCATTIFLQQANWYAKMQEKPKPEKVTK